MSTFSRFSRRGASTHDAQAHAADHLRYDRRAFLRRIGLGGAVCLTAGSLPATGLFDFPLAAALNASGGDRKLVLIRLKGGNDGLNTIVPLYALDAYRAARPTLAHAESSLLSLNTDFGVPPSMADARSLWSAGRMRVVNGVGYDDSSLSHFTGADIVASGNDNPDENGDGWLARYYVSQNPDYRVDPAEHPPAVKIGGPTSVLFNDPDKVDISANFANADRLEELANRGQLFDAANPPDDCYHGDQVSFLRTVFNASELYSTAIATAYRESTTEAEYRGTLGEQLRLVARLIKGGLRTQFYLVTLDGFDTHVGQAGAHEDLLADLSGAVRAFYDDLDAGNQSEDVLTMTYSEFGRRVDQNASGGTDHGTAMPVLFFGPALGGSGAHGGRPDLQDTDPNGNLRPTVDFRSLYATVLEQWFCLDVGAVNDILGTNYPRLSDLGFVCGTNSVNAVSLAPAIGHRVLPAGGAGYVLEIDLERTTRLAVAIVTLDGKQLRRLPPRSYATGNHQIPFTLPEVGGRVALLAYTLLTDQGRHGGRFMTQSGSR